MARTPEQRRRQAAMAGLAAAAKLTPEERTERARIANRASQESRKRQAQAAREALGLPEPTRNQDYTRRPAPTPEELAPFAEMAVEQNPTATPMQIRRQAILLRRQHLARIEFEAGRSTDAS